MKKEHFYTIVIIILLLLNLGTLAYLWTGRENNPPHYPMPPDSPDAIIINELQLDDVQVAQFQAFKHRHRKSTDSVQRIIRGIQKELFGLVEHDTMDIPKRDSLLTAIEQCESAKHLITIEHFHEIRSVLRLEQKTLFNDLMDDIGSRITGPGRPHRPPHHPR